MNLVSLESIDIQLSPEGQPVISTSGDFAVVEGIDCWKQDIMLEAATDEGELFYEDEEGIAAYGYSITDFIQCTFDDFERMKIRQRIYNKLAKRPELDERSIQIAEDFSGDVYKNTTSFKLNDSGDAYNMDMEIKGAEVIIND